MHSTSRSIRKLRQFKAYNWSHESRSADWKSLKKFPVELINQHKKKDRHKGGQSSRKTKVLLPEVESSRTHFEVLGIEASNPRKLPCPRLEDSTIFEPLKSRWKTPETLRKICKDLFFVSSSKDCLKKKFWRPFRLKKYFVDLFF